MKLDGNQKNQFIVLCCLVALVFGFGAYRLLGVGTSSASSAQTTKTVAVDKTPASVVTASSQNVDAQVTENGTVGAEALKGSDSGRDPFAPQIFPKSKTDSVPQAAVNPSRSKPVRLPPVFPMASIPAVSVRPDSNMIKTETVDPVKATINQMTVTGIVNGAIKVAIIRGSEGVRYIVREGQRIDGKYRVEYISSKSVWISYNNQNFVLRLGGNESSEKRTRP